MSSPTESAGFHKVDRIVEQLDRTIAEVFALMLNRDCSPSETHSIAQTAHASAHPSASPSAGIVASISFSGAMRGSCSIHLPLTAATAITGDLMGPMPESEAATLNADTAGEICNMIAGSWKSRQPDPHATCAISTPRVNEAELRPPPHQFDFSVQAANFRNVLVRTYTFEDHCLHLQLGFD